jgi:hypothetical protein
VLPAAKRIKCVLLHHIVGAGDCSTGGVGYLNMSCRTGVFLLRLLLLRGSIERVIGSLCYVFVIVVECIITSAAVVFSLYILARVRIAIFVVIFIFIVIVFVSVLPVPCVVVVIIFLVLFVVVFPVVLTYIVYTK